MLLSIIVPCFNEREVLPSFYAQTTSVLSEMDCEYELIFVDDGSKDETLSIIQELSDRDRHVFFLSFSRNFGKEAAMYAGFCNARGDYVAVMDADLQDPPELLPRMLQLLTSGAYDSVATRRMTRKGEPHVRSLLSRLFYKIINLVSETEFQSGVRDFRMMSRQMADSVISLGEANRFSKGIFGWIGFRTCWLSFENHERPLGESKWSVWKLFCYAFDGIIGFSYTPLRMVSFFGLFITLCAFASLLFVIVRKILFGDPVAGWASLISVILFIGGVQLFCLGIIGQYISRIYGEVKKRPHYIIAQTNVREAEMIR